METLKNYVNWKLAHSDKVANADGYPLVMENCKANKRMKQLQVYGDCMQRLGSKNLLPYPYYKTTATINGVTFTDNGDGSITINGTATSDAVYYLYINNTTLIPGTKRGDTITGSIFSDKEWDASVEKLYVVLNYYNANTTMKDGVILNPSKKTRTFTITDDWYGMGFYILVSKGGVVDNIILRVQIELGSTATEYEPYVVSPSPDCPCEIETVGDLITDTESEYCDKYKIPVVVRGKNLFDKDNALVFNGYFSGGKIVNYNPTASGMAIICINCKPNTSYTISRQIQSKRFRFASSTMPPGTDTVVNVFSSYDNNMSGIITTGENDIYLYVWFYNKTLDINYTYQEIMNGIQIEEGVVATEYEPYIEPPITQNIYLDEPLRKIEDYADYIDFKNKKVVRNIFSDSLHIHHIYFKSTTVVRFDGFSGTMTFRGVPDSTILSYIFLSKKRDWNTSRESIFQHYTTSHNWYWSIYWSRLGLTYDGTNVYRTDDTEQTPLTDSEIISIANEWIATLSDKDKTIYRVRKTPTEEDISCQLPKTLAKTTVISADTSLEPSNIKGKYIIK